MAIILDKYAIKEVADVMFYELDSKGAPSAPALYLDTLKTSTLSQSSETVDARGGKGNVKLLSWDTNKELTLELTDPVFSAKSLSIMFGGTTKQNGNTQEVLKTLRKDQFTQVDATNSQMLSFTIKDATYYINVTKVAWFKYTYDNNTKETMVTPIALADSAAKVIPADADYGTFDLLDAVNKAENGTGIVTDGLEINITSEFGGWLQDYMDRDDLMGLIDYVDQINLKYGATPVITDPYTKEVREIEKKKGDFCNIFRAKKKMPHARHPIITVICGSYVDPVQG